MKQPKTIGLLAAIALTVGIVGISGTSANIFGIVDSQKASTTESTGFSGHIIAVVTDADGNIKAYRQTDNIIVNAGRNCAADLVFGTGFGGCTGEAAFDKVALSDNTIASAAATDTTLTGECDGTPDCGTGLNARVTGTVASSSPGQLASGTSGAATDAITKITATFTKTAGSTVTINSAGLFDATTNGNMFAEKAFSSGVPLSANDQLTVTWLITLDSGL